VGGLVAALAVAVLAVGILLALSFFRETDAPARHASRAPSTIPAPPAGQPEAGPQAQKPSGLPEPADKGEPPGKDSAPPPEPTTPPGKDSIPPPEPATVALPGKEPAPPPPPEPAKTVPFSPAIEPPAPAPQPVVLLDERPRLALRFHDTSNPVNNGGGYSIAPSMRFGLSVIDTGKKLIAQDIGRSNNTCVRIDGTERLFGTMMTSSERQQYLPGFQRQVPHFRDWPGRWVQMKKPLRRDRSGRQPVGLESVWRWNSPAIQVTQVVEIVPGPQSRVLDTCLVRYVIENLDGRAHTVGLRFLLDTQIGANDGVPFLIPGETSLCDTLKDFASPDEVPEYVQAFERDRLDDPGTVALLRFKLGGEIEPPARVTLGVYPGRMLVQVGAQAALHGWTLWEVPVLPMKTPLRLSTKGWWPDSAVTLYWRERPLPPGGRRVVGFAYGLGGVAAEQSKGQLGLVANGRFAPGSELTVTALVQNPRPGETVTLTLPEGLQLTAGAARQAVPPLPAEGASKVSPVTWKVRAGKEGPYVLRAARSSGVEQTCPVTIRNLVLYDPLGPEHATPPGGPKGSKR
jgi:hypothetical protein